MGDLTDRLASEGEERRRWSDGKEGIETDPSSAAVATVGVSFRDVGK
jgi:hypothetical protein